MSLLVLCCTIALMLPFLESSMIYYPTRFPDGFWDVEELSRRSGTRIEDRFFSAEDGTRLHGWWCRPAGAGPDGDLPTLLFFHGNAGNLSHRAELVLRLTALPARVFIIDYRGYGRSEGKPSESGLYDDARAAWTHLTEDLKAPPGRVVLFGRSLGGAVAIDLATSVRPTALIVESSFTSVPDMARHHYPFIPGRLIRTRMDSAAKIGSVSCPKLFIHSPADEIVPFSLGRRLFDAAGEPKTFFEVEGAGHNETWLAGGGSYLKAIGDFLAETAESG